MSCLKTALEYRNKGLSIMPAKKDKKPYLHEWKPYQTEIATEEQVRAWWAEFPDANIAIITGKLSNLTVIDLDSEDSYQKFQEEYLSDSFSTLIAQTPNGYHLYCNYAEGVSNKTGVLKNVDIRSEGGYVIAPPSNNGTGAKYEWLVKAVRSDVPTSFINKLLSTVQGGDTGDPENAPQSEILFKLGTRDNDIFHVANVLVKGGMPEGEIKQLLTLIGEKVCTPPFPEGEINTKIQSALNRDNDRNLSLAKDIKEWVLSSTGVFMSSDVVKDLCLSSRVVKKQASKILSRLREKKIIEKHGDKRGCFRLIDRSIIEQKWWEGETNAPLPIRFSLDIHDFVRIYPGNVILLEGAKSQGKSSFALEFCRLNRALFPERILYQNLEMSTGELEERFRSYGDVMSLDEWRTAVLFAKLEISGCWDKISRNGLNIIDYLVEYKEPWKLPQYLLEVHKKLENGIALILVQRDPYKPYPTGGRGVRDIPRAVISLMGHKVRLEDVKSFHQTPYGNPTGLCMKYKHASWWKFVSASGWDHEEEEKYEQFKKGGK